jgi:outer membrane protein OmpA-like peptidoglycan-associated protein
LSKGEKLKPQVDDLEALKKLLLSTELQRLKSLELKYEALLKASYTKEVVLEKTVELFNEILGERLKRDDATVEILSNYITSVLSKAYHREPEALREVLQETVALSIAKQIEENRESMVDSLYPIIGGMIRKYVQQVIEEMSQRINQRIEEGFSWHAYKRKIRAKMTGVSESQLLLSEKRKEKISSLMVIQKESGMLIAEAKLGDSGIDDPHMVASMASAIKNFINDWIKQHHKHDEVQILTYGEMTLYIESAGSVYLIAFLEREPSYELRQEINIFFALLIRDYVSYFRSFDGDDSTPKLQEIQEVLEGYLNKQEHYTPPKKRINYFKGVVVLLLGLMMGYWFYHGYYGVQGYLLEQKVMEQTGEVVAIEHHESKIIIDGYLKELKHIDSIETLIASETNLSVENRLKVPFALIEEERAKEKAMLLNMFHTEQKKLKCLVSRLEIKMEEDHEKLETIQERVREKRIAFQEKKKSIIREIETKLGTQFANSVAYREGKLTFQHLHLFAPNAKHYNPQAMEQLKEDFAHYIAILLPYMEHIEHIVIEGHTDSTGSREYNELLSKERALMVQRTLKKMKIVEDYHLQSRFKIAMLGSREIIRVDGVEYKNASRRIEIYFTLKESDYLDALERVLDD